MALVVPLLRRLAPACLAAAAKPRGASAARSRPRSAASTGAAPWRRFALMMVLPALLSGCAAAARRAPTPVAAPAGRQVRPRPAAAPVPRPPATPVGPFLPNELGVIPVLEFHHFGKTDARWRITLHEFSTVLANLYADGFRPVDFRDVAERRIDLPKGYAPVVLSFDDGLRSQFRLGPGGQPAADSAVGLLWRFHRAHPAWALRGSFYVNAHPFGPHSATKLRWLAAHGFEIGDHTMDEADLNGKSAAYALAQVGGVAHLIQSAVRGYRVSTFAYPYGLASHLPPTTWKGVFRGQPYHLTAALLVGAGPAPSPYSRAWRPLAVPRIQVVNPRIVHPSTRYFIWGGPTGWEARLLAHRGELYASDGNPHTVTIPPGQRGRLATDLGPGVRVVVR